MSKVACKSSVKQNPQQGGNVVHLSSKATATDVARACGVSQMTVSRVFSGNSAVADKTKRRVQRVANELGYRPNVAARTMRGGRTKTIGLLMSSFKVPITSFKLDAIEKAARSHGYVCHISSLPTDDPPGQDAVFNDMFARQVDGIIVYASYHAMPAINQRLSGVNIPVVYLDRAPKGAQRRIIINRSAGIEESARYLASLGHRRVGYVSTTSDVYDPGLKVDLYRRAFKKQSIEMASPWEYVIDPQKDVLDSAYQLVQQLIQAGNLPTALIMNNDDGAMAGLAALSDRGIQVPDQVSVIGFDDITQATYCRPALTTIHQPREEAGVAAFEMLQKVMEKDSALENSKPIQQTFDCKLIVRGSTGRAGDHKFSGGAGVPPAIPAPAGNKTNSAYQRAAYETSAVPVHRESKWSSAASRHRAASCLRDPPK